MKRIIFFTIFLLSACGHDKEYIPVKKITIGFSQCTMVDKWREIMVMEMKRELSFYNNYNIDFIVKDAGDDNNKQIEDINDLVSRHIDILIVSANEAKQLTPTVEEVFNKGIPVILIDRKINSPSYTAFVGADNLGIGREAGYFAIELLKGKGKILEITGLTGSTPAIERSSGFKEIIKNYPAISIEKSIEGRWLEDRTLKITDSLFYTFNDFDLVFAHNDFMARAAAYSSRKHKLKPYIIGIDGLNTEDGGVSMVLNGTIDGTILYPSGGDKAIQLAMEILTGKPYETTINLNTFRIDNTNARTIWLQGAEIGSQQGKIDKLNYKINNMSSILKKRDTLLFLTTSVIILLFFVVGSIYFLFRQKNRLSKALTLKNKMINQQYKIISSQRDDSINLLMLAEEAKENKLRLFTDISHEFRTAVTLIMTPLDDLIKSTENSGLKNKLEIIRKNAGRLNKLSDSILRFRNIDENKYKPVFNGANFIGFLNEIVEIYREKANGKKITVMTDLPPYLYVDFDAAMMEKILCNLLSNAIKYTKPEGKVTVAVKNENAKILISIEDNGIGIPSKDIPYIFNRFYKAENSKMSNESEGVGVGLAITKELVQLHGGIINVTSFEGSGSVFTLTIPQFNKNTTEDPEDISIKYPSTLRQEILPEKDKVILVVEDNPDLLKLISGQLEYYYSVITASNGLEGLEITRKKIPSLIVSDIMMPVMDGLQMCRQIKNDSSTCHIPVILLTALDSQDFTIKGFEIGADAYLTKPYNENLLLTHIRNLLLSRKKIIDSYCPSSFFQDIFKTRETSDQDFIKKCLDVIYDNAESEDFGLDNLADKMTMSRSSLYRKIRIACNIRPVDFIKKARLNYSAKLLMSKNLHINEIAWRSGFSDPKYFSKCFYQEFGCYPKKYAQEFKSTSNQIAEN